MSKNRNVPNFRLKGGQYLLKLSLAVKSIVPLILTPKDIEEANTRFAQSPWQIELWSKPQWVKKGLDEIEKKFLERYKMTSGRFLVLGCGAGREVIALAKSGFDCVGIDFVDELIEAAKKNAAGEKVKASFQKQDIIELTREKAYFDYAMLSSFMYSCFLVRKKRVELLKNIKNALKPGGKLLLTLDFARSKPKYKKLKYLIRKIIILLTMGNTHYQYGNTVIGEYNYFNFIHNFSGQEEFLEEVTEAGFKADEIDVNSEYAFLSG